MKILVFSDLYPPYYLGGYELRCKAYVDDLIARGHQIQVLTSRWKAGRGTSEGHVHRLLHFNPFNLNLLDHKPPPDLLGITRRVKQLRWAVKTRLNYRIARQVIQAVNPALVFAWNMGSIGFGPLVAARDEQHVVVFRLGDYWLADLKYKVCLQPDILRRKFQAFVEGIADFSTLNFDHQIVLSGAVRQRQLEVGFDESAITIIPNGVRAAFVLSPEDLTHPPPDGHDLRLVYAGRLVPRKGVHIAIEALATLIHDRGYLDVHLDIIGKGEPEYVTRLHTLVTSLRLDDNVTFLGYLANQQVLERFSTWYDALLLPALWQEPLGVTMLEGMARGLPVVATDRGGLAEVISDGENGLLVSAGDPVELAGAVARLAEDPAFWQRIRAAGLETVREGYTHEHLVDRFEDYLLSVVDELSEAQ
jgi:glycogen(starch) synthase